MLLDHKGTGSKEAAAVAIHPPCMTYTCWPHGSGFGTAYIIPLRARAMYASLIYDLGPGFPCRLPQLLFQSPRSLPPLFKSPTDGIRPGGPLPAVLGLSCTVHSIVQLPIVTPPLTKGAGLVMVATRGSGKRAVPIEDTAGKTPKKRQRRDQPASSSPGPAEQQPTPSKPKPSPLPKGVLAS